MATLCWWDGVRVFVGCVRYGGFVPGAGVDSDGGEGPGLEGGSSGGERDPVLVGGQIDPADAVELLEGPCGGEVLVVEVGISDIACGESAGDERFA